VLGALDRRKGQVVEMRFFGGLTVAEQFTCPKPSCATGSLEGMVGAAPRRGRGP
jgi:hypothetical protein